MPQMLLYSSIFFIAGLVFGSFFNVCIYRIPREQSIVFPASHCTSCDHTLSSMDLFPLFSWIILKGRCRYCRAKISIRYPLVELLTGIVFIGIYLIYGLTLAVPFHIIFASIMIIVTFIDIDFRIIPDRFIIIGAILAILKFFVLQDLTWKDALLGGAIGGGFLLLVDLAARLFYKKEGMGLGDVKLMLMAGVFLGITNTIVALLAAVWTGAIAGIIILRVKRDKEDRYMPFGPFLAIGSLISLVWGRSIVEYYLSLF